MTAGLLYALAGALVFSVGLGGAVLCRNLVRRILAFNVLGSGAFLMLVGLGQRGGAPDPVPQAMVLTGIVVAVAGTALALALVRRLAETAAAEEHGDRTARPPGSLSEPGDGERSGKGMPCSASGRRPATVKALDERASGPRVRKEGAADGQQAPRAGSKAGGRKKGAEGRG